MSLTPDPVHPDPHMALAFHLEAARQAAFRAIQCINQIDLVDAHHALEEALMALEQAMDVNPPTHERKPAKPVRDDLGEQA